MREALDDAAVAAALATLDGWDGDRRAIRRTARMPSFQAAIDLVNAVARVAEEMDHHPDIDIRYRDVTFTCWTHTAGAVSELDVRLARAIDRLVASC